MKKLTILLCLISNSILTSAFANETPQSQSEENPRVIKCHGKLEGSSAGYLLTTEIAGFAMMINISQKSGEQFGQCSEGDFLVDLDSKEDGGVKILNMDCLKKCSNPESLSEPVSFYSHEVSAYFAATDTCMQEAFRTLGMVERAKPEGDQFINEFFTGTGFAESTMVYSEKLNVIGEVGQFNTDGRLLIEGLGFKVMGPDAEVPGAKRDDLLKWRFRVCDMGTEGSPSLKSCALLPERFRIQF